MKKKHLEYIKYKMRNVKVFTIYEYNMDYLMKMWYSKNEK